MHTEALHCRALRNMMWKPAESPICPAGGELEMVRHHVVTFAGRHGLPNRGAGSPARLKIILPCPHPAELLLTLKHYRPTAKGFKKLCSQKETASAPDIHSLYSKKSFPRELILTPPDAAADVAFPCASTRPVRW